MSGFYAPSARSKWRDWYAISNFNFTYALDLILSCVDCAPSMIDPNRGYVWGIGAVPLGF